MQVTCRSWRNIDCLQYSDVLYYLKPVAHNTEMSVPVLAPEKGTNVIASISFYLLHRSVTHQKLVPEKYGNVRNVSKKELYVLVVHSAGKGTSLSYISTLHMK